MKGGIYKTKHGWQVRFGNITKRFKKHELALAERFLTGVRYETDIGKFDERDYRKDNPLGFTNQADKWLQYKAKTKIKPRTLKNLEREIGRAQEYFGQANIKTIREAAIEDFIFADHLTYLGQPIASKTRHSIASALHQFFVWVARREQIQIPAFPTVQYELGWREIVDMDTQLAILDRVRAIVPEIKIYLGIKWLSENPNVRPGEMVKIKEGYFNLQTGIVLVRETKERRKNAKYFYLEPADIEIIKSLPKALPDLPFFRHNSARSGVTPGSPFGPTLFNKWTQKACKGLGVSGIGLYALTKHSTVTALGELLTPEEIKRGTEHQTNAAFERYMLPSMRDKIKVRTALKQLRGDNEVITENEDSKIVNFPKS